MVVVWESTEKVSATIAYGTDESKLCDPIKVEIDADAPDFKGSKMNLFHYKLDNLTPGTRYYYEVKLEGGATCKASFKTLSEKTGSDPSDHPVGLAHFCDPRRTRSGHQGI